MSQESTNAAGKGMIIVQGVATFLGGAAALGAVLFLAAWTLRYWRAWTLIVAFMVPLTLSSTYFSVKDPALIERRKLAGRKLSPEQKVYIPYIYALELGMLIIPALDHRFGWSRMPDWVSIIGSGLVVLANVIWFVSKKENSYAGSALKIYEGQTIVTSGPYALVRHPNYVGDLTLVLGVPLTLGSWWGLILFALMVPAMVWMIFDEEKFLKKNLPGYVEYTQTVDYRLIPHIW